MLVLRSLLLTASDSAPGNLFAAPLPAHRAFFCRFDDDLDRKGIPLRMRLGDLETVNRKEGKPGW